MNAFVPTRLAANFRAPQTAIDDTLVYAIGDHALGRLLVARSPLGVCAILFDDSDEALLDQLEAAFPRAQLIDRTAAMGELLARIGALIDDEDNTMDLPLDIGGTAFQQTVWRALREIPRGTRASYRQIAERIGKPDAARAVAAACAANVLAVAIPCHRVVRGNGELSGYRWGAARKRELLRREMTI